MNFTANTELSITIQNFLLQRKLLYAAIEGFNVKAQYRRCITSLFVFEFNELCYYVPYVYFVLFLNMFRDFELQGEKDGDTSHGGVMRSRRWRYALGYWPFPNCVIFLASSLAKRLTALIAPIDGLLLRLR